MNFDDIFYPFYLEFYSNPNFYDERNVEIEKLYNKISDGGFYKINYVRAKNGDYCFSVFCVYNGEIIYNRVGYKNKNIALMSIIHWLRTKNN